MTRDQASDAIVEILCEGDSFGQWDIAKIMDGYPCDEIILLLAKGNYELARDLLKHHVERFMVDDYGQDLIDLYLFKQKEARIASAIESGVDEQWLRRVAGLTC